MGEKMPNQMTWGGRREGCDKQRIHVASGAHFFDVLHSVEGPGDRDSIHPFLHERLSVGSDVEDACFDVGVDFKDKLLLVLMALNLRDLAQRDASF